MLAELEQLGVAHIAEYGGAWAIYEPRFRTAFDRIASIDLRMHVEQQMSRGGGKGSLRNVAGGYENIEGVAVIEMSGPLMKMASSLTGGSSTVAIRQQIRNAVNDPAVHSILMWIDSPGGTVSGTSDLAADIAAAAAVKPTVTHADDLMASAAFWAGSQASKVFANSTALVGSIGTYMVIEDSSGMAAMDGVKVHVVRAGDFKGMGVPGTEVTAEQLADSQRIINDLNAQFLQGVASGRRMSLPQVQQLADGRVHVAAEAQKLGLIDGVQSFDATLQQLIAAGQAKAPSSKGTKKMSEENTSVTAPVAPVAPSVASFADIEAACPGCDASFVLSQLKSSATVSTATAAWMAQQKAEIDALKKQSADAKAEAEAAKNRPGVPPLKDGAKSDSKPSFEGDPVSAWNAAVAAERAANPGLSADAIVRNANRKNPGLREQMVAAINAR